MNNKRLNNRGIILSTILLFSISLGGCVSNNYKVSKLTDMQSIALCQTDEQALQVEKRITAEYGFKRFSKKTYRPMLEQSLFGHRIRVVELGTVENKLYIAGNPKEFEHHFGLLLKNISCEKNSCQAPINDEQTLHIYKVNLKKAKDTTVIECTKPKVTN